MADILPLSTNLNTLMEGGGVDVTFTPLFSEGESLVSINITEYEPTPGINVESNRLFGVYESVFTFPDGSLLYRENDDFKSARTWEDLPPPKTADLYLWRAPGNLQKTFSYKVEMIYKYQAPDEPGSGEGGGSVTPAPVERTLTKVYTQLIVGNWSRWANQLRNYVYSGN